MGCTVSTVKVLEYRGDRVRVEIIRSTLPPFPITVKILGSRVLDSMWEEADKLWKKITRLRNMAGVGNSKLRMDNGRCIAVSMECDYDGCVNYTRLIDKQVCEDILPLEDEYRKLTKKIRDYKDELSAWLFSKLGDGGLA